MVDKSKLPSGLRVQMIWAPETTTDPEDRPIALLTTQRLLLIPLLLVFVLSYQYGLRGRTGYYELSEDGSLGEFLGLKTPVGLSAMHRSKA